MPAKPVVGHITQNSGQLIIPRISKEFSYLASKFWNSLLNTVCEADTLCQFKSRIKMHLFDLQQTHKTL